MTRLWVPLALLLVPGCDPLPVSGPKTTLFIARHGEYVADRSDDPQLNSVGLERAKELARVLDHVDIDVVYATQFARTRQTAQPAASSRGLAVHQFDADEVDSLIGKILSVHGGQEVLIVAHGDTAPRIIKSLRGRVDSLARNSDYDDLFVVTPAGEGEPRVLHLKYGEPPSAE